MSSLLRGTAIVQFKSDTSDILVEVSRLLFKSRGILMCAIGSMLCPL